MASYITKPMLAGKCTKIKNLVFPLLATPKLDGIRCLKINGKAVARSLNAIPNLFVRKYIEDKLPDGLDGELIVKGASFNEVTGAVRREEGEPDFTFAVFDYVSKDIAVPYDVRIQELINLPEYDRVEKVVPEEISSLHHLLCYEDTCIDDGYEGVMIRTHKSPYKCGRATELEGYLLKIKRFEDAEAIVLDTYEGLSNQNVAEQNKLGRTKRSKAKTGMQGREELGGFVVKHKDTGVVFRLGYNHVVGGVAASVLWQNRKSIVGKLVKFRHQPSGSAVAPRFPTFVGFRDAWDMS